MKVEIFSQPNCQYCVMAKRLLDSKAIQYHEYMIGVNGITKEDLFRRVPSARTVPQIIINNTAIGGYEQLVKELATNDNFKRTAME